MADCYAYKSEFGAMFARVVTLLRFEILGGVGELETTNLLTGGHGDHKRGVCFRVFSPAGTRGFQAYKYILHVFNDL